MESAPVREPFCLEWKIVNLGTSYFVGTTVDFDHGRQFQFQVYIGRAAKGPMMVVLPRELESCYGQLVIKGSDGSVLYSMEKTKGTKILQFEHLREQLVDNFVLFIKVENACENPRYEYATTLLQLPPVKERCLTEDFLHHQPSKNVDIRKSVGQLIPSLETLSIGKESSHQPSKNDLPSTIRRSMSRDLKVGSRLRRLSKYAAIMRKRSPRRARVLERIIRYQVEASLSNEFSSMNIGSSNGNFSSSRMSRYRPYFS